MSTRVKRLSKEIILFNILAYSLVILFGIICILPIVMIVMGSFASDKSIITYGYTLIPKEFSMKAYELIFKNPGDILRAYGMSIIITSVGCGLGLFMVSMTSYVLSKKEFKYRNMFAFFFYFTTLFSGGIVSSYILYSRYLLLKDSLLALIFPLILNVFYIIVMRSFIVSIPESIAESAKVDGAGEFTIFIKLILPLLKPALASIGLFIALDYWNDWYHAMLYINNSNHYPLQYLLYKMLNTIEALKSLSAASGVPLPDMPQQSMKLAMTVIAVGPIIFLYPFVQKYFVQGITLGAVKG